MQTSDVPTGRERRSTTCPSTRARRRRSARRWDRTGSGVDFGEAHPQPSLAGKQRRQIRGIDLRQVREHVEKTAQAAGDRTIHPLPDHRLRLRVGSDVSAFVENLDEANLRPHRIGR